MSVRTGGKGPGHLSRWPKAVTSGPTPYELVEQARDDLIATDAPHVWNPADTSLTSMSASRTTLVQVTEGGAVGQVFDQKGSFDLSAANDGTRPIYMNGLTFDGLDDALFKSAFSLPNTASVVAIYKGTDTFAGMFGQNSAFPMAVIWNAASAINPTQKGGLVYSDGVNFTAQNALSAEVSDGVVHVIENRGFTPNTATAITNPSFGVTPFEGRSLGGILLPVCVPDDTQADIATQRAAAATYASALIDYFNL